MLNCRAVARTSQPVGFALRSPIGVILSGCSGRSSHVKSEGSVVIARSRPTIANGSWFRNLVSVRCFRVVSEYVATRKTVRVNYNAVLLNGGPIERLTIQGFGLCLNRRLAYAFTRAYSVGLAITSFPETPTTT